MNFLITISEDGTGQHRTTQGMIHGLAKTSFRRDPLLLWCYAVTQKDFIDEGTSAGEEWLFCEWWTTTLHSSIAFNSIRWPDSHLGLSYLSQYFLSFRKYAPPSTSSIPVQTMSNQPADGQRLLGIGKTIPSLPLLLLARPQFVFIIRTLWLLSDAERPTRSSADWNMYGNSRGTQQEVHR